MKKFLIASVSAVALMGLAACSNSTDNTTTQSVPQTDEQPVSPAPGRDRRHDDAGHHADAGERHRWRNAEQRAGTAAG